MANPVFFDLHCHPGLKSFLTASKENDRVSCWNYINVKGLFGVIDRATGHMLDSNSSLSQLDKGSVSIAVVGLYAYERTMVKGILNKLESKILSLFRIKLLDYNLLHKLSSKKSNYYRVFRKVQKHLLSPRKVHPEYNLMKRFSDFDPDKLNVVLSIEGGHNLFSRMHHNGNAAHHVMKNFLELKNGKRRYFFFGPAHLETNPLCTHAYGMKMIDNKRFKPDGEAYGISSLGKSVIRKALENPGRILIDVKHMSLVSRLQYYEMLKNSEFDDVPIIISHAGVTGVSYKSMPIVKSELTGKWVKVEYRKPNGLMRTSFNPWSINLYDEEIDTIIKSKGLIGMNLDERILGTKQRRRKELTEYFSREDFRDFEDQVPGNGTGTLSRQITGTGRRKLFVSRRDVKHLCNNILHIVRVGGRDAWDHICIGSDFDGLVDTIDYYNNASELARLRLHMIKWLLAMARSDQGNFYYLNSSNVEKRVDSIMFANAFRFLKTNFN